MLLLTGLTALVGACSSPSVRIVQEQVRAYNARDLEWFVGQYSPNAAIHNLITGEAVGQGENYFRERYSERFGTCPDLHATIHRRIAFGEFVIDYEEVVRTKTDPTVQAVAIYAVAADKITDVWFAFDHDLKMDAAENTERAFAQHEQAVRGRDLVLYESTFAADARILSFPDGKVLRGNREEIMAEVRPLMDGDERFDWRVADQILFGNLVINLERQRVRRHSRWIDRVVIYEFAESRIRRCWVLPGPGLGSNS